MARPDTVTSGRRRQVAVHRIETVPMTRRQRDQAVTALAVLTSEWSASRSPAAAGGTLPLPLPGAPSNTDDADEDPAVIDPPAGQRPRKDTP